MTDALSFTDIVLVVGIAGYLVERFVDAQGWSRSSRTLRKENEDLVRRNTELEQTVERHEITIQDQGERIAGLTTLVDDMKKSDQAAVLHAIELHEANAAARNESQGTRHAETLALLREIRDAFKEGAAA